MYDIEIFKYNVFDQNKVHLLIKQKKLKIVLQSHNFYFLTFQI